MVDQDHDLLIELRTLVTLLRKDVQDLRDGLRLEIAAHETRIRKLEDLSNKYQPDVLIGKYDKWGGEWEQFKARKGVYSSLLVSLGGLAGVFLKVLLDYLLR